MGSALAQHFLLINIDFTHNSLRLKSKKPWRQAKASFSVRWKQLFTLWTLLLIKDPATVDEHVLESKDVGYVNEYRN